MRLKIQRSKINVALFATSDFATLTLQTLLQDKAFNLKALYTQKPQKSGRGMQLNKTPVHKACEDFIIQNPKNEDQWGYWEKCEESPTNKYVSLSEKDKEKRISEISEIRF